MPSDHAQLTAFSALLLVLGVRKHFAGPTYIVEAVRSTVACLASAMTFVVAYSRIHLRFHSVEQVLAGYGLGAAYACVVWLIYLSMQRRLKNLQVQLDRAITTFGIS